MNIEKRYICVSVLFFTFIFTWNSILLSQAPYELFNSKSVQFFGKYPLVTGSSYFLKGIKPDSVKLSGNDSIYYQFRTTTGVYTSTCVNSRTPTWTGFITRRRVNGDYIFYNNSNDSILIKTQTPVGSSWIYYTDPVSGNYLLATVSQKTFAPIYDVYSDTIKIISFQNYNSLNQPIYHYYNSQNFILSKTQGMIRCGTFLKFPYDTSIYTRSYGKTLKRIDVYNYNIGDEVHTQTKCYSNTTLLNTSWNSFLITGKTFINPDSVFYTTYIQSYSGSTLSPVTSSTLSYGKLSQYMYTAMPEQTNLNSTYNLDLNYVIANYNTPCQTFGIFESSYNPPFKNGNDTCLTPNTVSPVSAYYTMEHVGSGFYSSPFTTGFHCDRTPYYTKIGGISCGTPLTYALKVNESTEENGVKIYPNPAFNTVNIVLKNNLESKQINIIDIMGRKIIEKTGNVSEVDIEGLDQGVYQVEILTKNDYKYTQKIIKQ